MLEKLFETLDKIVFSNLLTPTQDVVLLVVLNLLVAKILISSLREKRKDIAEFRETVEFDRYVKHLFRNGRWVTILAVGSFVPTLRIIFEFFDGKPTFVVPNVIFVSVAVFYVNFKNCKLLSY